MNNAPEEMDTQDALANSAGTSANDPRPTSVNDTRIQPEDTSSEGDLVIDAGGPRTAAFDEGSNSETRDEHRADDGKDGNAQSSRH